MNDFIRLNACYSFCVKTSPSHHVWIVVVLVLLASTAGCRSKDPVAQLMEELEQATEARDVNAFEKRWLRALRVMTGSAVTKPVPLCAAISQHTNRSVWISLTWSDPKVEIG